MFSIRLRSSVGRAYCRHLVPALGATLSTSLYLFADTVMVGHRLGGEALAALNVMVPLEFSCFSVGAWLGNGGAICLTHAQALGNGSAKKVLSRTLQLALALMAVLFPLGLFTVPLLARGLLGADAPPALTELAVAYGRWIAFGSPCFILGALLPPLLRHTHAPRLAMRAVVCGGVANIVLDWLFLYPCALGIAGAAIATVMGSALSVALMVPHLLKQPLSLRDGGSCAWQSYGHILHIGAGSFLQEIAGCVTLLLFNRFLLAQLGEVGVVIYTIPANVVFIANALFSGVVHAAQPLVVRFFHSGANASLRQVLRLSTLSSLAISLPLAAYGCWKPHHLIALFLDRATAVSLPAQTHGAIAITLAALPIMGLAHTRVLQLPALGRASAGLLFSCLRNGALSLPIAWLLVKGFGPWHLWWCFLLADFLLLIWLHAHHRNALLRCSGRRLADNR